MTPDRAHGAAADGGPGEGDRAVSGPSAAQAVASVLMQPCICAAQDGQCTYSNPAWADFTGMPPELTMGKGWALAIHPRDRAEVLAAWSRFLDDPEPLWIQCRVQRAHGNPRWVRFSAVRLPDSCGSGILAQFEDLTNLQRTRQALSLHVRTLELVDQLTPVGQWRLDSAGGHFWGSRTVHRLQNTDPARRLDLDGWLLVFAADERDELKAELQEALSRGDPFERTARIQGSHGARRVVGLLGRAEWNLDGEVSALFGVMRELSDG